MESLGKTFFEYELGSAKRCSIGGRGKLQFKGKTFATVIPSRSSTIRTRASHAKCIRSETRPRIQPPVDCQYLTSLALQAAQGAGLGESSWWVGDIVELDAAGLPSALAAPAAQGSSGPVLAHAISASMAGGIMWVRVRRLLIAAQVPPHNQTANCMGLPTRAFLVLFEGALETGGTCLIACTL